MNVKARKREREREKELLVVAYFLCRTVLVLCNRFDYPKIVLVRSFAERKSFAIYEQKQQQQQQQQQQLSRTSRKLCLSMFI